ncbi:tRNA (guanine37-N1)-methyltransferase [Marchantia polymorpha subsp. ruderalis]
MLVLGWMKTNRQSRFMYLRCTPQTQYSIDSKVTALRHEERNHRRTRKLESRERARRALSGRSGELRARKCEEEADEEEELEFAAVDAVSHRGLMSADFTSCLSLRPNPSCFRSLAHTQAGGGRPGGLFASWSQRFWDRPRCALRCCLVLRSFAAAAVATAAAPLPLGRMKEDSEHAVVLDREKFKRKLQLKALRIPKEHSHFVSKTLSRFTLERQRLKHVIHDPLSAQNRLVLLAENVSETGLPEEKVAAIKEVTEVEFIPHEIDLDYSYFTVEQVLKEILPEGWKVPASFETVGHIAHLNLTDELLPYRKVIAEVFLDKNSPKIRTIVNKVGTISNEFRVPTWEVLAGDTDLVAEVKQQGSTFRLDFGLVYWNSRLEFEHKRLPSQFKPGQVIVDMFAGIGPFAIPAAQKGCVVLANDLNPDSIKYLKINAKVNKVEGRVFAYNMDAREFMKHIVKKVATDTDSVKTLEDGDQNGSPAKGPPFSTERADATGEDRKQEAKEFKVKGKAKGKQDVQVPPPMPWEGFHHVPMNLPASALEFLDVFQGLLSRDHWKGPMPRIHCYCFMRAIETHADVLKRAEGILGGVIKDPQVWTVRDVAPNKIMLCISFDLPEAVAFGEVSEEVSPAKFLPAQENLESAPEEVSSPQPVQLQSKRPRTECEPPVS